MTAATRRFQVEAQEPCGAQAWAQMRPPEFWRDETGTHDGLWEAGDEQAAIKAFLAAYPNRHPAAKSYKAYRAFIPPRVRTFELVEVTP